MKINLHEDEISGEVQDGSVDLEEEFKELLTKIRRAIDGWPRPVLPDVFGEEIHKAAIDIGFDFEDEDKKIIKWTLKGYFKEDEDKPANFVIPRDIIANGYRVLVDYIKTNFPEVMSYPKEILSKYYMKAYDFDVFTKDGIIAGRYFMRKSEQHDYESMFDALYPLEVFLTNVDTIAQAYVLPYDFKFADNYSNRYYFTLKKGQQFGKAYLSGKFEGHSYKFKHVRVHISPAYRSFNTETLTLENSFFVSVDYSLGLFIDGEDYSDQIDKHKWDRETTEFGPAYRKDLIEKLKPIFKSHGLEVT